MCTAPCCVGWHAQPALLQQHHDACVVDTMLFERKNGANVFFGADIAYPIFVSSKPNITNDGIVAGVGLEWFEFKQCRTPAHLRRGEIAPEYLPPMVETSFRIET